MKKGLVILRYRNLDKQKTRQAKCVVILWALVIAGGLLSSSLIAQEVSTISYDQIVTSSCLGCGKTMTSKVWIKGNNMRIEQTVGGQQMITLIKEGAMYSYYPSQKMAMKMDASAKAGQEKQENPKDTVEYLKSIEAKPLGQESIEGKLCDVYQITYPQTGTKGKIWVWKEKNFPLKSVMTVGGETLTTEYRNVQMGISIPDSYFELPPGTQIMDMSRTIPGVIPQE